MSNRPDPWERINSGLYQINMVDEDDACSTYISHFYVNYFDELIGEPY